MTNKLAELLKQGWQSEEPEQQQIHHSFVTAETLSSHSSGPAQDQSPDLFLNSRLVADGWNMQHVDFDVKSTTYSIFKVSDYNWKEDGFELVRRFLPGLAPLLDEEFNHIYNMTYNRSQKI